MDPMVGRDGPLAAADAAITDCLAGRGGLLLISGEPGIGKTRLVQAIVERAGSRGVRHVAGYAVDDPGAPALWPWRRALRSWPEAAGLLAAGHQRAGPAMDDPGARFQLFVDLCEQLRQHATPDGLLLILEDMHWADQSSVLLLQHLAGELDGSHLLVVVSYRANEKSWLAGVLDQLVRGPGVTHVALRPLRTPDIEAWLRVYPVIEDRVRWAAALSDRTGGNPLLVRLVTQALHSSGTSAGPAAIDRLITQQADLRRLIAARTAALSGPTNDLLGAAAVIGERIHPALLTAVTGMTAAQTGTALDEAVAAGVLTEVTGEYQFVHALVRDCIYADLHPAVRARWHRRCAVTLESRHGDVEGVSPSAGSIAEHWRRTGGPDAVGNSLRWAKLASLEAMDALAHDDAVRFAELAVQCARELQLTPADSAELMVHLGEAQFVAGRVDDSLQTCVSAADLAESAGDAELLAAAGLVVQGIGTTSVNRVVRGLCQRALAALGPEPSVTRARLLAQVAAATAEDESGPLAEQLSAEAVAAAEATGDPGAILEAIAARHLTISVPDMVTQRLELGRRAIELGTDGRRPIAALWGHLWRADAAFQLGNLAEVDREIEHIDRIATSRRSPLAGWHHHRLLATRRVLVGDFVAARAHNRDALELAAGMGDISLAGLSHAFAGELAQVRGDTGEMPDDFRRMLSVAPDMPLVAIAGTVMTAIDGDLPAARASFEAFRDLPGTFPVGTRWAATIAKIGTAAVLLGDPEVAAAVYQLLSPTAFYFTGDGSGSLFSHGSNSGLIGALALTAGRAEDAVRHFGDAIAMNVRIGARPFTALARLGLAQALFARRGADRGTTGSADLTRARELVNQAADEFRRLDMPGPLRTAAVVLSQLQTAERDGNPLSPRETEIAALVSESLTNKAIADRLFLSERTVETHVRSILTKLGFSSRTEIVSWELQRRG